MSEQQQREQCRKETRAYLAERAGLAFDSSAITRGLRMRGGFQEADVRDALNFLKGRGHVLAEPDGDGATLYWQITADGTLAYERS